MPFGPPSLCAERLTRLACHASTGGGPNAADWTASVWKGMRRSRHKRTDLGNRLDGADLVVGGDDADERRPLGDRGGQLLGVDAPVSVHGEVGDLEAVAVEDGGAVHHRLVLDAAGDDVAAVRGAGPCDALQRQVVGLGSARGEDDLAGLGAKVMRDLLAGLVEALAGAAARRVDARRVAMMLGEIREHGLEHLRSQRRRRRVIEVDRHGPMIVAAVGRCRRRLSHGRHR